MGGDSWHFEYYSRAETTNNGSKEKLTTRKNRIQEHCSFINWQKETNFCSKCKLGENHGWI